jgi:hypothetical protein
MAELGQDAKLALLLLEVARDLDAEADLIEAGLPRDRRSAPRIPVEGMAATLRLTPPQANRWEMTLTDLSLGGARLSGPARLPVGARVILDLPACGVQLPARVARVEPGVIAVAFATDQETLQSAEQVVREVTESPVETRGHCPA